MVPALGFMVPAIATLNKNRDLRTSTKSKGSDNTALISHNWFKQHIDNTSTKHSVEQRTVYTVIYSVATKSVYMYTFICMTAVAGEVRKGGSH